MIENQPSTQQKQGRRLRQLSVHVGMAMAACSYAKDTLKAPEAELEAMLHGIRKYQTHDFDRDAIMEALPVVWQEGGVTVRACRTEKESTANILLIPSMINRSTILDLLPDKSFTRWLAAQGFNVYLLDWGNPVDDPALIDVDSALTQRLLPAIEYLRMQEPEQKLFALGYCMGGTVLAAAAHMTDHLSGLIFLASPWDFHAGKGALADQVLMGTPSALQMISHSHKLPMEWIQSVFAAVNAKKALYKFAAFAEMDQDSAEAQLFVAVEDWLNDGPDLPQGIAQTCITTWYGENRPVKGRWSVCGKIIDPATIKIPALVVASARDILVPAESALALAKTLPQVTTLEPDCGHIGMMTGRDAEEKLWVPLARWLVDNSLA